MPTTNTANRPDQKDQSPTALVITRNLPPLVGGMERLIWHIIDELSDEYHIHVIGPVGCGRSLPSCTTCTEIPLRPMFRYFLHTQLTSIWRALRQQWHLVVAGSGLTAPFVWLAARISGASCVVYLHGLDIEARHPLYRLLWRPFFRFFDCVMVNSHFTKRLALQIGIPQQRVHVLHPGVTVPDHGDADAQRSEFRVRYNLGNCPLILYVGRLTARKGFAVFCEDILPGIVEKHPSVRIVVVGDEPSSALLQAKGERAHIEAILTANGLKQRILFLGELAQDDPELSDAYFAADVLVFPVQQRKNDNEGFGMVALEAAAHGLATVAFASGGVTDAVADGVSGTLIPAGDNKAFSRAVVHHLTNRSPSCPDEIVAFASKFAWPLFGEKLRHLCSTYRDH